MAKYTEEQLTEMAKQFLECEDQGDPRCIMPIIILSRLFGMTEQATINKIKRMSEGNHED